MKDWQSILHKSHFKVCQWPIILRLFLVWGQTFSSIWTFAQYFSAGQSPASIRWKILETDAFKIIFPAGFEASATRMANILEYTRTLDTVSLKSSPRKIPVIMHQYNALSNGFVSWAPRRMELYTVPPQDSYAQDWLEQLAIHEYRHVIQVSKMNQGLTGTLSLLFGEQLSGAVLGLYVPMWFMEGDAVLSETLLSYAGRGRQPSFSMPLRAQILEQGIYSYDKAVFGSYRDFVPDHYVLGYHLVAMGRVRYGMELWDDILDEVARNPIIPNPFHRELRKKTDKRKTDFYRSMLHEWKDYWKEMTNPVSQHQVKYLTSGARKVYTSYIRPQLTSDHTVIAEKKALNDIAHFVQIDSLGKEQKLHIPGFYFTGSLAVSEDWLVWSELEFDLRWRQRNYAVLKAFNRKSGVTRQITHKTRLYSPCISPDQQYIAAVEADQGLQYHLTILSFETGEVVKRFSAEENNFISQPSWSRDGKSIVFLIHSQKGKAIAHVDLQYDQLTLLTDYTYDDIAWPILSDNQLIFRAPWTGADNLYRMNISTREITPITSAEYGVDHPSLSPDGKCLLYSEYTPYGFVPVSLELSQINSKPLTYAPVLRDDLVQVIKGADYHIFNTEEVPYVNYPVKPHPQWKNLLHFHSWAPLSIDPYNQDIRPGISVLSQNLLSSAFLNLGWEYLSYEKTGRFYTRFIYSGWYPVFDVAIDYGRRKGTHTDSLQQKDFSWRETNMNTGLSFPLNLTNGKYSRYLTSSIRFYYTQRDMDSESDLKFRQSNFKSLQYRVILLNFHKMSGHDLYPRWGQSISFMMQHTPFPAVTRGMVTAAESRLFFPGASINHSVNMHVSYQKNTGNAFTSPMFIRFSRGYPYPVHHEIFSWSVNYAMPLIYPDMSLPSLLYLKRVRTSVFFDQAFVTWNNTTSQYSSTGLEVYGDMHLFRFITPVAMGARVSYRLKDQSMYSEFIFSANFVAR